MSWSTRELAELAGTSERAVRHYHDMGLLALPERRANGYKSYGVLHLVRLLRIRRLVDLGFSLPQIVEMDASPEATTEALHRLDSELARAVERIQATRGELASMLRDEVSADLPPGFAPPDQLELTEEDRSVVHVLSRVLDADRQDNFRQWLSSYTPTAADHEFDRLAPDADEATRAELAERMLPSALEARNTPAPARGAGSAAARRALREIYNTAQLDVLRRVAERMPPATGSE